MRSSTPNDSTPTERDVPIALRQRQWHRYVDISTKCLENSEEQSWNAPKLKTSKCACSSRIAAVKLRATESDTVISAEFVDICGIPCEEGFALSSTFVRMRVADSAAVAKLALEARAGCAWLHYRQSPAASAVRVPLVHVQKAYYCSTE